MAILGLSASLATKTGVQAAEFKAGQSLHDSVCEGIDLNERPILEALATDLRSLFELCVERFRYRERKEGYTKCHLCIDLRRRIAQETD